MRCIVVVVLTIVGWRGKWVSGIAKYFRVGMLKVRHCDAGSVS